MPGKRNRDTLIVNYSDSRYLPKSLKQQCFLGKRLALRYPTSSQIQTTRYQGYELHSPKKFKIERCVTISD